MIPDFGVLLPSPLSAREQVAVSRDRSTIAWFDADPARQIIDRDANARWDKLLAAWDRATGAVVEEF